MPAGTPERLDGTDLTLHALTPFRYPMLDPELLKILCCPETHQPLTSASPEAIEKLNQRIQSGEVLSRGGKQVKDKIDGGLVRQDGKFLYPIRNNIPIMLIDEAIPLQA